MELKYPGIKEKALLGRPPTGWGQTLTLTTKKKLFISLTEKQFLTQLSWDLNVCRLTWSLKQIYHSKVQGQINPDTLVIIPYRQI